MGRPRNWTEKEDEFIVSYFDAVGKFIGPHDLGRLEREVESRAAHLKKTGAWQALEQSRSEYQRFRSLAGYKSFDGE